MKHIDINLLENNIGQILGVNQNPRDLEISGFELTKKSIAQFPKMLSVRQLVVVEHDAKYVIIGGNQRLRAMVALGYTEAPCIVVDWSVDEINEFIIKDNLSYGEWNYDMLANEWNTELLTDWGLDLPVNFSENNTEFNLDPNLDLTEKTKQFFKLEINCLTEYELQRLYEEMQKRGLECRILN